MNHTKSRHTIIDSGLVDQSEIVRSLRAIVAPDQVIEVRALNAKFSGDYRSGTISGYFEASNLEVLAAQTGTITEADGIYFVVNPCNPALLARAVNKLRHCGKSEPTTADHDILIRRYLLVDCDPARPAKIASSDEEHDAALDRAVRMSESLNEDGWPDPIFADSGNGGHLLYDINEACDDAGLIASVLEALNNRFGDSAVTIDQTVFNPARIWKLYGTRACKGDPDAEWIGRPHRMARILSAPDSRRVVTHSELIALVEKYGITQKSKKAESTGVKAGTKSTHSGDGNDWITEFIKRHNLKVLEPVPYKGGRKWVFEVCPFNSDHNDASAVITEAAGGGLGFKCHHNGCSTNDWHALRNLLEPERHERSNGSAAAAGDDKRPPRPPPIIRTVRRLVTEYPTMREPIIHGLLRRGETLNVIAPPKTGKSWLTIDLALAVATGRGWLGFGTERGDVLIVDNELHGETSADRIPRVGDARGISRDEYFDSVQIWNCRGQLVTIDELRLDLGGINPGRYRLIVLDALYRFIPSDKDENNNATMAGIYSALDSMAARLDCAFVCIHHASKGAQGGKAVTDVGSGAGAQSRAADSHLVIRQHEQDGIVVVDAACRSFAPIEPVCLRLDWPVFQVDREADPSQLRKDGPRARRTTTIDNPPETKAAPWNYRRLVSELVGSFPESKATIEAKAVDAKIPAKTFGRLFEQAVGAGLVFEWPHPTHKLKKLYATVKPPITDEATH